MSRLAIIAIPVGTSVASSVAWLGRNWAYATVPELVIAVITWAHWRWTRYVPRSRTRSMRFRVRLGLRPGRGFDTMPGLWFAHSRFAAWRRSARIRPSLGAWHRYRHPDEHSSLIGRAQRRMAIRVPHEEHTLITGPPRTGKSGLLGAIIMHHQGPVLSTSTKGDMYALTSGIRAQLGPIAVFNPGGVAAIPSTIRFDVINGCRDAETAVRRADAFTGAISMKGTEGGDFFGGKASSYMRALFAAADIVGADMRLVNRWVLGSAEEAEQILSAAGAGHWAAELAEMRGDAVKTAATCRMVMTRALAFMNSPSLAASVLPGDGLGIEEFLCANGTLYMIADSANEENPVAPVFAAMAAEVHHTASMAGSKMPGQRLDPPLRMALDECVSICPIPLPVYLSDSGGKGITIAAACHSISQMRTRWTADGAAAILATAGTRIWLSGTSDLETVEMISKLSGQFSARERLQDHHSRHATVTEAMVRTVPAGYAVILRGDRNVTIAKLERAWKQRAYRRARRQGQAVAALQPVAEPVAIPVPERLAVQQPTAVPDPLAEMVDESVPTPWERAWKG